MKKTFLFDMDGVIIDSEPFFVQRYSTSLSHLNIKHDLEVLKSVIGTSQKRTDEIILELANYTLPKDFEELTDQLIPIHQEDFSKQEMDGIENLLKTLKQRGHKTALCSSSPIHFIQKILNDLDFNDYFDVVLSGDEFNETKPHPEIYLTAANKLGVEIENCIVIEDSIPGLQAAHNAGMKSIMLRNDYYPIQFDEADYIIHHLDEVMLILDELE